MKSPKHSYCRSTMIRRLQTTGVERFMAKLNETHNHTTNKARTHRFTFRHNTAAVIHSSAHVVSLCAGFYPTNQVAQSTIRRSASVPLVVVEQRAVLELLMLKIAQQTRHIQYVIVFTGQKTAGSSAAAAMFLYASCCCCCCCDGGVAWCSSRPCI